MTQSDKLIEIRDDLRKLQNRARAYRNQLPPAAVSQAGGECVNQAIQYMDAAAARLNEAIGWTSERP